MLVLKNALGLYDLLAGLIRTSTVFFVTFPLLKSNQKSRLLINCEALTNTSLLKIQIIRSKCAFISLLSAKQNQTRLLDLRKLLFHLLLKQVLFLTLQEASFKSYFTHNSNYFFNCIRECFAVLQGRSAVL